MNGHPLPNAPDFNSFSRLTLDDRGRFLDDDGKTVQPEGIANFLKSAIYLPPQVTDVFIWVHGWRNTVESSVTSARRLFAGIEARHRAAAARYPKLNPFIPAFVAVYWPSRSLPLPAGYGRIRDRAKNLTENGYAEFFLASLLGYLDRKRADPQLLQAAGGFYLHCVGHSLGGRFLTAAIRASAEPHAPDTLSLLDQMSTHNRDTLGAEEKHFDFTVDSLTVFQMAVGSKGFADEFRALTDKAPLRGPIVLTFTSHDTANCRWHRLIEGESGVGCVGAQEPVDRVKTIAYRPLAEDYVTSEFSAARITNVDASWAFRSKWFAPQGAHSAFWLEESIHLLLSAVSSAR